MKGKKAIGLIAVIALLAALFPACGDAPDESADSSPASSSAAGGVFDMESGADGWDASNGGSKSGSKSSGKTGDSGGLPDDIINSDTGSKGEQFSGRARDLKGKTITIQVWNDYMKGNDSSQQLLSERSAALTKKIESTFHCKLKYYSSAEKEPTNDQQLRAAVAAGQSKVDIWWLSTKSAVDAYKANFLVELSALKVINFGDRKRYSGATEILHANGKYYGVGPRTYGVVRVYTNNVLIANLDLLNNVGVPLAELTSFQKNGKWNWDNFEKTAKKVKDNAAAKGYNTYALNAYDNEFYKALMSANNTDWAARASDGGLTFSGGDARGQNVLRYLAKLRQNSYVGNVAGTALNQFAQGKTAFVVTRMYAPIYVSNTWDFEYTIMYPPMGDDAKAYRTATDNYTFATIPKGKKPSGCTDAEIATVLDAINTQLISDSEDVSLAATRMARYMRNPLAKDTVMSVYNNKEENIIWSSLAQNMPLYAEWNDKVKLICANGGSNMAQILGEVTPAYNTKLKDMWK